LLVFWIVATRKTPPLSLPDPIPAPYAEGTRVKAANLEDDGLAWHPNGWPATIVDALDWIFEDRYWFYELVWDGQQGGRAFTSGDVLALLSGDEDVPVLGVEDAPFARES
jgi:hypothetical protein